MKKKKNSKTHSLLQIPLEKGKIVGKVPYIPIAQETKVIEIRPSPTKQSSEKESQKECKEPTNEVLKWQLDQESKEKEENQKSVPKDEISKEKEVSPQQGEQTKARFDSFARKKSHLLSPIKEEEN